MAAEMRFLFMRTGGPAQLLEQGRTNRNKIVQTLVRIARSTALCVRALIGSGARSFRAALPGWRSTPTEPAIQNFAQHRTNGRNSNQAAAGSNATLNGQANNRRRAMKPYIMTLLISTIVVVCNLVGRRQTIERAHARLPSPSVADRRIGR